MKLSIKKFSTIAVVLLVSAGQISAQKGLSLQITGSPQFSLLLNSDDLDSDIYERKTTFNVSYGLGLTYHIQDNMGIGIDAIYATQGQTYELEGIEFTQKLNYLKVPLYLSISSDMNAPLSVTGKFGPMVGILLDAKFEDADGNDLIGDNKDAFEDIFMGAMVGLDMNLRLSQKLFFTVGAYADMGWTNVENEDFPGHNSDRANTYNFSSGLNVGLKYNLGK